MGAAQKRLPRAHIEKWRIVPGVAGDAHTGKVIRTYPIRAGARVTDCKVGTERYRVTGRVCGFLSMTLHTLFGRILKFGFCRYASRYFSRSGVIIRAIVGIMASLALDAVQIP